MSRINTLSNSSRGYGHGPACRIEESGGAICSIDRIDCSAETLIKQRLEMLKHPKCREVQALHLRLSGTDTQELGALVLEFPNLWMMSGNVGERIPLVIGVTRVTSRLMFEL